MMNTNGHALWPGQPNIGDPTADDFAHFLNFGDIPLSFDGQDHHQQNNHVNNFCGADIHQDSNAMDTDYSEAFGIGNSAGRGMLTQSGGMDHQMDNTLTSADIMGMELQRSLQQQLNEVQAAQNQRLRMQQQLHHLQLNRTIPPTPSSLDLQGGDITPHMYHNIYGIKDDNMFTPLVSPAVTPLDTHFTHLPDYAMSGGCFSPLTSPALPAQRHGPYTFLSTTNTSKASSPIEPESPVMNKKVPAANTARRKSLACCRNPARVVRESPIMKPQRRKPPSAFAQAPELAQSLVQQQVQLNATRQLATNDATMNETNLSDSRRNSSSESISPEPMPESIMPPPPPPSVKTSSQNGSAQQQTASKSSTPSMSMGPPSITKPATPASLMKIAKSNIPVDAQQMPSAEASLKMIERGQLGSMDGNNNGINRESSPQSDEQPTPTMNARAPSKTPRDTPLLIPSNSTSTTSTRNPSPVAIQPLLAKQPTSSAAPTPRLTPKLQPSNSRTKRSVPASPALVPKISPNIKPLLNNASLMLDPASSLHTAASIILANKSNYQNIVEGNTTSLGLSYPEDLSAGLTSKRTSHKIAEQGRRNRINMALQEMASLLPPNAQSLNGNKSDGDGGEGGSTGGKGTANQATSKAVTVERAIEYIRALKKELEETKSKLRMAEEKLNSKGEVSESEDSTKPDDKTAPEVPAADKSSPTETENKETHSSPNGGEVVMLD